MTFTTRTAATTLAALLAVAVVAAGVGAGVGAGAAASVAAGAAAESAATGAAAGAAAESAATGAAAGAAAESAATGAAAGAAAVGDVAVVEEAAEVTAEKETEAMAFRITSPSFEPMGEIPIRHTCEDKDMSPALSWADVPDGTKSLALIVDDPDAPDPKAPRMTWVHWVLYNLPPDSTGLAENMTDKTLPPGTLQGISDFKRTRWGGPCPPIGRHRYFFKLYALDTLLPDLKIPTKATLLKAMESHILAQAELIGTYQKKK